MALLLAIDSSAAASVAVLRDGEELAHWATDDTHAHAEVLAPAVQTVLGEAGVTGIALDALAVGVAAWRLGAGRARKEDPVQAGAGVELHAKPGDSVRAGQPLLTLHTDTPERFERAKQALEGAYEIGEAAPKRASVVLDRIT